MTKVDQFESVFRAAAREVFQYEPLSISRVLVVCDLSGEEAAAYAAGIEGAFARGWPERQISWSVLGGDGFAGVEPLLAEVEKAQPDLICTYRNLRTQAWKYPYSLGVYLDVLTQAVPVPVMVLPHPQSGHEVLPRLERPDHVMAITDHLTGDHRLVNHAVAFTPPGGHLYLSHIEDEVLFAHIMTAVSKLPFIDTEEAREGLRKQLLKDPHDYVGSCREVLEKHELPLQVEEIVSFGHHLSEYKRYVDEQKVDLLVMNTKDEDQMAMHGLAYPLAVELRQVPLLLL